LFLDPVYSVHCHVSSFCFLRELTSLRISLSLIATSHQTTKRLWPTKEVQKLGSKMDPITAVGLVAAAAQLTANVKCILVDYLRGVIDAPKQSRELRQELGAMCELLDDLQNVITTKSQFASSASLKKAIEDFNAMLNEINEKIQISKTKGVHRLTWPFAKDESMKLLERIKRYNGIFNSALNLQTL